MDYKKIIISATIGLGYLTYKLVDKYYLNFENILNNFEVENKLTSKLEKEVEEEFDWEQITA